MQRRQGWEQILDAEIRAAAGRHFEWGAFDCCLWVCDVVEAMTGVDMAADLREGYKDRNGAVRLIRKAGCRSLSQLCANVARWWALEEILPLRAGRGDVVLVKENGRHSLAIVGTDGRYALATAAVGLGRMPQESWVRAWRV